jgi:heme a synthase
MSVQQNSPAVAVWLWCIAVLIFLMVIVGGATRLTDSGLSITEWQPLLGVIPPLNEADWQAAFAKYKLIPEYQIQNRGMSLADFQFIYWWEWAHRFLGRVIGLVFVVPLVYLVWTKRVARSLWPKLVLLFVVGGLQGALGWYMVSSGLSERVDVSQYRLAAHLTLAVALFAAVVLTALTVRRSIDFQWNSKSLLAVSFIGLLFLQVAAGGFVAGLDAGHASYTWPKMEGAWIPNGLQVMTPQWRNLFENALAVQFNHRVLAYLLLLLAIAQFAWLQTSTAMLVLVAVIAQACLGIFTVVWQVPLTTALAHQGGALVVIALAVFHFVTVMQAPVQGQQ